MKKNILSLYALVFLNVIGACLFCSATEFESNHALSSQKHEYFQKMDNFGYLTDQQMARLNNYIVAQVHISDQARSALVLAVEDQRAVTKISVFKLKNLYQRIFVDQTGSKEDRKALVFQEANLSIAVHRQLVLVRDFLKTESRFFRSAQDIKKLAIEINQISMDLKSEKSIPVTLSMGLGQVLQAGENRLSSACKLLAGLCTRKSLSVLMDSLDERNFLRFGKYEFTGIDSIKKSLDGNAKSVFILIGNHDQPLMDIAVARKAAMLLGSDHHSTMTRKSVYPIPPPESAGDVVFVVDNDPKSNPVQKSIDLLSENILKQTNHRVSLAVYPEGMLPYTGGQMPMSVKEGAFVIARKLAYQLSAQNIPVFVVRMKTNIIEHLTAIENIPARVEIQNIEKVPDHAVDRNQTDFWIENQRLKAEESFNSHRGRNQIDIFNLDKVPLSQIPYAMRVSTCSMLFLH